MAKMLRDRKQFGRCRVHGHGNWCSVSKDIQETAFTRHQERLEVREFIEQELNEMKENENNS